MSGAWRLHRIQRTRHRETGSLRRTGHPNRCEFRFWLVSTFGANKSVNPKSRTPDLVSICGDTVFSYLRELRDALQILQSRSGFRCSDRGFLNMSAADYNELLDWTARGIVPGKCGATPAEAAPIFERMGLGISAGTWCELVANFGKLLKIVAGNGRSSRRPSIST